MTSKHVPIMWHKSNQKVYSIYIYHLISENEIHISILQFLFKKSSWSNFSYFVNGNFPVNFVRQSTKSSLLKNYSKKSQKKFLGHKRGTIWPRDHSKSCLRAPRNRDSTTDSKTLSPIPIWETPAAAIPSLSLRLNPREGEGARRNGGSRGSEPRDARADSQSPLPLLCRPPSF